MSTILYRCESWINISLRPLETLYVGAVKSLLGVKHQIKVSNKSKMVTYKDLNPTLQKPCLYTQDVPEHVRIKITRIRLSSHNLKIETGHWSRLPKGIAFM